MTTSAPTRTGTGSVPKWPFLAALGVALVVAVGIAVWQLTDGDGADTVIAPQESLAAPVTAATRPATATGPTYFVVASQAEADVLQASINDANMVRAQLGDAPLPSAVLVADSAEAETRILRSIVEDDAIRGGMGEPAITVVDLRSR